MNGKPTSAFRWSAKAGSRKSKHCIFAPLRLRVNKITRRRMRSWCKELVHAETRRRFLYGRMNRTGDYLVLLAKDVWNRFVLPKRNTSASPRLRANQFFGCAGDWRRYVRAEAQRLRVRVEVALMHRSARGSSGRLAVFAWACRKTGHFLESSEHIVSFAEDAPSLLPVRKKRLGLPAWLSLFVGNQTPRPACALMPQVGPGSSVVAAQDAGEFALDADLGGGVALGVVGSVCRV